jgi:hypothetical protein
MQIFFLEADTPLTKTYSKRGTELTKTPYPFVWEFTSHKEAPTTLAQLEALLKSHAAQGHCLLKGTIQRPLVKESRAGSTDSNSPTDWVVLDLDGLPETMPDSAITLTVDLFLEALGLKDVSYIVQWSASYGIENKKIRAHIFMQLDKPAAAPLLKQWLTHLNHVTPLLRKSMALTKTGNSISWALDISACQNDKLIYIAPPILKGIKDPIPSTSRIQLVKHKNDKLSIAGHFSSEKNREATNKRLEELREVEGLPKRKYKTKMHGSHEILIKPDVCTVTEMKQERGFVYFNLNGGDSWAYYHPENNPEFILNFKGEPAYLTKELMPDYWSDIMTRAANVGNVLTTGAMHLAFCDRKTSGYFIGKYHPADDELDIHVAKNSTQVRDYAKQAGLLIGDYIPVWDLVFDPNDNVRVDLANKVINTFNPSPYMKATPSRQAKLPKTILKIITHALGDPEKRVIDHFLNWCAFIIQKRDRTMTAWVLHGTEGTGKGILSNNILRPILGMQNTTCRRMEELSEPYNPFMKNSFLVVVDEVQTTALQNERGVMAKLRNFITDPKVPIRAMYATGVEFPNYSNWIFNSNMPDPVTIPKTDRRFNVARYQTKKLIITDKEIQQIEKELQAFHDYLLYYPLDEAKARTPIETADRTTMISIGESSIDTVSNELLSGNFDFFMDQLPAGTNYLGDNVSMIRLENYKHTLTSLIARTDAAGKCSVSREELRVIYDFVIGSMPSSPNKFTSLLKHHRVHIEKVWLDGKTVSGIKATWQDLTVLPVHLATLTPASRVAAAKAQAAAPIHPGPKPRRVVAAV